MVADLAARQSSAPTARRAAKANSGLIGTPADGIIIAENASGELRIGYRASLTRCVAQMKIIGLKESFSSNTLKLKGLFADGRKIDCFVTLPHYYISVIRRKPPMPIRSRMGMSNATKAPDNMVGAYRVANITANPKKCGLGSYILFCAAVRASRAGLQYLLAMSVNPRTHNWYKRMGFLEYDVLKSIETLREREAAINFQMVQHGDSMEHIEMLTPALIHVKTQQSEMIRFAPIKDVIRNTKKDWNSRWERDGPGWTPKN